jgi:glutaminyl-peptide cyclotransferase
MRWLVAVFSLLLVCAHTPIPAAPKPVVEPLVGEVIARYPHDRNAFTQGLLFDGDILFESTGKIGASQIRRVRLSDGRVLKSAALPTHMFGEGMTLWRGELISITWQDGTGFRWDSQSLKQKSQFAYPGEGWGLTDDGQSLYLSDGTPDIRVLDPASFAEQRRIRVTFQGRAIRNINELEWVNGALYANIWQTTKIVRIDPASGAVTAVIDLAALAKEVGADASDNVLNGIAYDKKRDLFLVTGKNWPTLFAIKLRPRPKLVPPVAPAVAPPAKTPAAMPAG